MAETTTAVSQPNDREWVITMTEQVMPESPALSLEDHLAGQLRRLCAVFGLGTVTDEYACLLSELLGPVAAQPLGAAPAWPSEIADDHTPVEYSITFDADRVPKLRFLVEPGSRWLDLRATMDTGQRVLHAVAERYRFSLQRFHMLEDLFLPSRPQGSFGLWIGVELGRDRIPDFKLYLNPGVHGPDRAPEIVREAMARLGFGDAFGCLLRHGVARGHELDRFYIFSLDVGSHWEKPRVKVYVRHDECSADEVERPTGAVSGIRPGVVPAFCRLVGG